MLRPRRITSANEDAVGGRRAEAAAQHYRMSWYSVSLVLGCFILFAVLMVGITLSLTLASPEARYIPPTMESSVQTTTTTTTITGGSTVTIITAGTTTQHSTTVPATLAPLAITCPPSITLTLGTSLSVPNTGPNANASGGCGSGPIIIQYVDAVSSSSPVKRFLSSLPSRLWRDGSSSTRSTFIKGHSMTETSMMVGCDEVPTLINNNNKRNKLYNRSPSFSAGNLLIQGTPLTYPLLMDNITTNDAVVSASSNHVVMFNQQGYALVLNKTTTALISTFSVDTLSPSGSVCSATGTNNTFAESQMVWDQSAQQWLFFRVVVEADVNKTRGLCVHISSANETNPMLSNYTTYYYKANITARLQVGLWTRVYALSFISQNVSTLCVLDRVRIFNVTAPMFCATSFDNNAPHLWSPVDAQSGPLPLVGTSENANSPNAQNPGAVFMRSNDDEFYSGANSPTVDRIEIEHWYNINFTTSSYNSLRYPVLTRDFDESMSNCSLTNPDGLVCITTPAAQKLNIVRGAVKFNYRAHSGNQQSIVTSLNSHSGRSVYWFEMRWQKPNPNTPERWDLVQDQGITAAGDFKFAPIVQMDVNGTILLSYTKSSNITYPSLYMTSRLANDPVGFVRNETLLAAGSFGSLFASVNQWQSTGSIAVDPSGSRTFFVSGAVSAMPPQSCNLQVARVRVLGEVIQRVWSATDGCNANVTCVQTITTL